MPTHECLGPDDCENLQDRRKPAIQLDKEPAIIVRGPDATMQPTPQDNQLMPKHRVLSFRPQLRLEWRGHDGKNETEQPDHSASLGDSITSSTRIGFSVHTGDAGTRPAFDLVPGVSSGALIAPFVFLGRERDGQLREIFTKYGRKDIYTYNVNGLIEGLALTDDTPLVHLIEKYVDDVFLQEVAMQRTKGRILLIGTTNLDTQRPVLWDMGRIAMSNNLDAIVLFRKILLASATLPGVFPPVRIHVRVGGRNYDELHVDGGVTRQVFFAPSIFSFAAGNQKLGRAVAKRRLYVIKNGRIDPEWQPVGENVMSITARSISTLIKNQGIGDLYRIYSISKRDGIDFNLASIPPDFREVRKEPFDAGYMNALFDRGYDLASHNYSWVKAPPGLELATQARN